jgi:archaellum component FlaG (FlaF/FlaG flagellin family)
MASLQSRLADLITALGADIKALYAADSSITANTQTGTTYTLVLSDAGKVVELNNASAVTVTIPPNASVAFPVGAIIEFCQVGAGQVTFSPGAAVTLVSRGSAFKCAGQYATAYLRQRAANTWVLTGDITT